MLQDHQSQNCPLRSFRSPAEPNMLKPLATVCLFLISVVAGTLVIFRFGKVIISTVFLIMSHLRPGKEKVYVSVLYFLKTFYGNFHLCFHSCLMSGQPRKNILYFTFSFRKVAFAATVFFICVLILAIATVFWFLSDVRSAKDNDHKFTSSWAWRRPPRGVLQICKVHRANINVKINWNISGWFLP